MGFWTFVVLLVPLLIIAAGAVYVIALARRSKAQLAAGIAVPPGMPEGAPPEWAGSHSPEAKLHRRLAALARSLAALPLGDAAAIERKVALEGRVQDLDRRLIAVAHAPDAARKEAVSALEPEAAAAEAEVGKLAIEPGSA